MKTNMERKILIELLKAMFLNTSVRCPNLLCTMIRNRLFISESVDIDYTLTSSSILVNITEDPLQCTFEFIAEFDGRFYIKDIK